MRKVASHGIIPLYREYDARRVCSVSPVESVIRTLDGFFLPHLKPRSGNKKAQRRAARTAHSLLCAAPTIILSNTKNAKCDFLPNIGSTPLHSHFHIHYTKVKSLSSTMFHGRRHKSRIRWIVQSKPCAAPSIHFPGCTPQRKASTNNAKPTTITTASAGVTAGPRAGPPGRAPRPAPPPT